MVIEVQELDDIGWIGQYLQIEPVVHVPYWYCTTGWLHRFHANQYFEMSPE